MEDFNPYSPPVATGNAPPSLSLRAADGGYTDEQIAQAREELERHIADASAVAEDDRLRSQKVTWLGWVALLFVAAGAIAGATLGANVGVAVGAGLGVVGIILLAIDLGQGAWAGGAGARSTPEGTMRQYIRSHVSRRIGTAFASLSPWGRRQSVAPPDLSPIPTPEERFVCQDKKTFTKFARTHLIPGAGQIRWTKVKAFDTAASDGAVARVRYTMSCTAMPQWANVVAVVAFVLVRLVGIILYAVFYFALRKRCELTVERTLLRGSNGLWYVMGADPLA